MSQNRMGRRATPVLSLLAATALLALGATQLRAEDAASGSSDSVAQGKALYAEGCMTGCHAARFGGDATKIFTRTDRKKNDIKAMAAMVSFCANQLNTGWFPEDEAMVTEYLNTEFYHLTK
ncbi:cytochrome c [Magnetofaba australis]|nr:cytochrome c [Magnetofaba australis]